MTEPIQAREEGLFQRVTEIIEAARGHVARTVNSAMVHAYWLIGHEIVEVEQHGRERAGYGEEIIERLTTRLSQRYGTGFSASTLRRTRLFYLTFPEGSALTADRSHAEEKTAEPLPGTASEIWSAVLTKSSPLETRLFPPLLGWTHYLILMRVENPTARAFYEIEAAREGWSTRELERQIASLLFERLARSRDREEVLAMARRGQAVSVPSDVIKDPCLIRGKHAEPNFGIARGLRLGARRLT